MKKKLAEAPEGGGFDGALSASNTALPIVVDKVVEKVVRKKGVSHAKVKELERRARQEKKCVLCSSTVLAERALKIMHTKYLTSYKGRGSRIVCYGGLFTTSNRRDNHGTERQQAIVVALHILRVFSSDHSKLTFSIFERGVEVGGSGDFEKFEHLSHKLSVLYNTIQ